MDKPVDNPRDIENFPPLYDFTDADVLSDAELAQIKSDTTDPLIERLLATIDSLYVTIVHIEDRRMREYRCHASEESGLV